MGDRIVVVDGALVTTSGLVAVGLPLDIRDQMQSGVNEYLNKHKQIREINTEADEAIKVLDNCALMVNARKISDDMDRSRLSQALRATIR
ncbi:MAG: hypothetical protein ACOZE7_12660 [Pseudomonadota bacterium]